MSGYHPGNFPVNDFFEGKVGGSEDGGDRIYAPFEAETIKYKRILLRKLNTNKLAGYILDKNWFEVKSKILTLRKHKNIANTRKQVNNIPKLICDKTFKYKDGTLSSKREMSVDLHH